MLPSLMPQTREYEDEDGQSPFGKWFDALEPIAAARVRLSVAKLETGLLPNVKSVGGGVHEAKVEYGPGYRVYFAFDGKDLVLLLGGGQKGGQSIDVAAAQKRWVDYKKRKRAAAR